MKRTLQGSSLLLALFAAAELAQAAPMGPGFPSAAAAPRTSSGRDAADEDEQTGTASQDEVEQEPVFVTLQRDPYVKRYGRAPGDGWIPLLETRTELRLSGFLQLGIIHDFKNAGFPYGWFVPALIPVPTEDTPNTEFDPRASRVNFETRTNTEEVGSVRTMFDIDFYGNLSDPLRDTFPSPRLRQAYVTWVGARSRISFTAGQAWTSFVDLLVWPEILDLQGPQSMTGARNGLVRGSYAFGDEGKIVFDASIEQPKTLVQNGTGLRSWPDFAARLNWQADWGHLQGAVLLRQLLAESMEGGGRDSSLGYGLLFSGSFEVPGTLRKSSLSDNLGPRQDRVQFQLQGGSGSGRYVNDLTTSITSWDAVYDPDTAQLDAIDQWGGFVAYHHWWSDRLRSQLVYSYLGVDSLEPSGDAAYDHSHFALANLAWRAFTRMDVAVEYLWGERRNNDRQSGRGERLMIGFNYGF